ncbi:hypothetical protein BASA84_001197 [Batrachochytrium salamandrivorans]|nr:hypothetical protein BASA84_001197 [Batrachochytrium salamandrivorans]KAH9276175.1 hypothetical protein BASA83_001449 [Batrachochytrium salamandrivorans]
MVAVNNSRAAYDAALHAADLCSRMQTDYKLLIVYCIALNPQQSLPGIDRLERAFNVEIEASAEQEIAECQSTLQDMLSEKVSYEFFVVEGEGETGPVLEKYIKEMHPHTDMFVIGTRNNAGIKRWALGSLSDYCVHHLDIPVVVVKPKSSQ